MWHTAALRANQRGTYRHRNHCWWRVLLFLGVSAASHLLSDSFWEARRGSCGLVCVSLRRCQFAIPSAFSDSQTLQRREEWEHTDCKMNFGQVMLRVLIFKKKKKCKKEGKKTLRWVYLYLFFLTSGFGLALLLAAAAQLVAAAATAAAAGEADVEGLWGGSSSVVPGGRGQLL